LKFIFSLFISAIIISCNNPVQEKITVLSADEALKLDSMHFDKIVVYEVKQAVDTTFNVLKIENRSGQVIPEKFMPKMIKFDLNYLIEEEKFAEILSKNTNPNYNIYKIIQENKTSIIISKL
jgi:hypothetical protein